MIRGRNGWLFLSGFPEDNFGWYADPDKQSQAPFRRFAAIHRRRCAELRARGLPLVMSVAPDPAFVYPEHLPEEWVFDPAHSPFRRFERELTAAERVDISYPIDALVAAHSEHPAYPPRDFHWTQWGAYIAYRSLMLLVRRHLPAARLVEPADIVWSARQTVGMLGAQLADPPSFLEPFASCELLAAQRRIAVRTETGQSLIVFDGGDPVLPSALMFRGSYTVAMLPFLLCSFRRLVLVRSRNRMLFDIVAREHADIVILDLPEIRLVTPGSDHDAVDARIIFGDLESGDEEESKAELALRDLLRLQRYDEAVTHAAAITNRWPASASHHYFHALALNGAGLHTEAAAACLNAIARDDGLAAPCELLGNLARQAGDDAAALQHYERAIALAPAAPRPRISAARLRQALGDHEVAEAHLRLGIVLSPDDPALHFELATLLRVRERPEEALAEIALALSYDESVPAYWQLAAILSYQLQRWGAAVAQLERYSAMAPDSAAQVAPFLAAARAALQSLKTKSQSSGSSRQERPLRLAVGAIFKNECPYIVEWLAYHRVVGVDRFFIADNGSDDGSSELLASLQDLGIVEHLPFPDLAGTAPQLPAYRELMRRFGGEADWIAFIDADEFLQPMGAMRSVKDLLQPFERLPDVGAVVANWAVFGSSGLLDREDRPVIERFERRAPQDFGANHHYKSIVRSRAFENTGGNPHFFALRGGYRYVHANGQNLVPHAEHGWGLSAAVSWECLRLNHYVVKSRQEFDQNKRPKGSAATLNRYKGDSYFSAHDRNDLHDSMPDWLLSATKAEMYRLQKMLLAQEVLS